MAVCSGEGTSVEKERERDEWGGVGFVMLFFWIHSWGSLALGVLLLCCSPDDLNTINVVLINCVGLLLKTVQQSC